jgi:hypothetical protein
MSERQSPSSSLVTPRQLITINRSAYLGTQPGCLSQTDIVSSKSFHPQALTPLHSIYPASSGTSISATRKSTHYPTSGLSKPPFGVVQTWSAFIWRMSFLLLSREPFCNIRLLPSTFDGKSCKIKSPPSRTYASESPSGRKP